MDEMDLFKIRPRIVRLNIHCDGCGHKVQKTLQEIEGVYKVIIDVEVEPKNEFEDNEKEDKRGVEVESAEGDHGVITFDESGGEGEGKGKGKGKGKVEFDEEEEGFAAAHQPLSELSSDAETDEEDKYYNGKGKKRFKHSACSTSENSESMTETMNHLQQYGHGHPRKHDTGAGYDETASGQLSYDQYLHHIDQYAHIFHEENPNSCIVM